ncbi:hypothetical protein [Micromonospora sp. NPDC048063]|uniref:hypothetical protein n=1 Tax=Micromonospora sp. NPDC048063 TaxID=3364256 RepID=UPI00371E5F8D
MITIQRVRVRWSAAARGAQQANLRRGLSCPVPLPASLPMCDVAVHEVLYNEATGYVRHDEVLSGGVERARDVGLWLTLEGSAVIVERLPGRAAFPRDRGTARLFPLASGQVGRYRANFRFTFTQCACNPSWFYEDWAVHVANGPVEPERFIQREPDHDADNRVHLYGGTIRPAGGSRHR